MPAELGLAQTPAGLRGGSQRCFARGAGGRREVELQFNRSPKMLVLINRSHVFIFHFLNTTNMPKPMCLFLFVLNTHLLCQIFFLIFFPAISPLLSILPSTPLCRLRRHFSGFFHFIPLFPPPLLHSRSLLHLSGASPPRRLSAVCRLSENLKLETQ